MQIVPKSGEDTLSSRWRPDILCEQVDLIFDYFESKTCSNCKHCEYLETKQSYMCISNECNAKWITLDFGCNRFSKKD